MSLRLRKIVQLDLEKIMMWRMSPEVTKYMYSDPVLDMEKQTNWFETIRNDENCRYWIIVMDEKDIGLLNITNIDRSNLRCDWAYYIADTSFRGRGIGKTLECNIYDYVFNILKMNKLCCEVMMSNPMVISLHEKFGSCVEGERKQHYIKDGEPLDIVEMAILKNKWEMIKDDYEYETIIIEN